MAEHVWSVLCNRGILDQYTNNVSLIDIAEAVHIQAPEEIPTGKLTTAPAQLSLVSLWRRTDYAVPEKVDVRFVLEVPYGGKKPFAKLGIDLEKHKRSRAFVKIATLPVKGPGESIYWFHVEMLRDGEWRCVASVPLEVNISVAEATPEHIARAN